MSILSFGASDIGKRRKSNQDSIWLGHEFSFFAVADGMGGHNGGDIASQLAVRTMESFIKDKLKSIHQSSNNFSDEMAREKFSQKTESELHENLMKEVIQNINHSIFQESKKDLKLEGMGTTIAAISFAGPELIIGNVGDSRVYLVNQKRIYQLTRDHSFIQEKISSGFYTRDQALNDPQRNILTKSVGFESDVMPDVFHYKVCKNDVFLICSDGLHGKVTDEEILSLINEGLSDPSTSTLQDVETTVMSLIDYANQQGGHDNISVILSIAQGS